LTQHGHFEDDSSENHRHAKESDPTPEAGDEYDGAQVLLPHGDQVVAGQV
jgi:hypothetical protein